MVVFGLAMYTYGLALYCIPLFLCILAIYLLRNKQVTGKEIAICITIYIAISLPIFLMYLINFLKLNTISLGPITIQHFEKFNRTEDMLLFSEEKGKQLVPNIQALIRVLVLQDDGLIWNTTKEYGTIYVFTNIFTLIGLGKLLLGKIKIKKKEKETVEEIVSDKTKDKQHRLGKVIFLTWFGICILMGLLINGVNINRFNTIWYPILMLASYGIAEVIQTMRTKKGKIAIVAIVMVLYSISFMNFITDYHTDTIPKINNSYCFSGGYIDAIAEGEEKGKKTIYIDNDTSNPFQQEKQHIYIEYMKALNSPEKRGVTYEEVTDATIFKQRKLTKEELYVVMPYQIITGKWQDMELEKYQIEQIGSYLVIDSKE